MGKMTQVKFTIESDIVAAFKSRCASEGMSMAAAVKQWMGNCSPGKTAKIDTSTRPGRRKAVQNIIALLNVIMDSEGDYRDNIPEQFAQRYDAADHACAMMEEAIGNLEDAF